MNSKKWVIIPGIIITICSCKQTSPQEEDRRFFSETSFWNQPIQENPEIDTNSDHWIGLLISDPSGYNFGINATRYTVPVYEVDEHTPRYLIEYHYLTEQEKEVWKTTRDRFGHGPGFEEPVPIPDSATPDPLEDAHMALIDRKAKIAWDMWGVKKMEDGSWVSNTGMRYPLNGDGVFETEDLEAVNGESIHFHGPSRASAVPAIAGLIMYEEVMQGEIRHKLSCGTRFNALQEFVYPAAWTDGWLTGGIPEGAVIQLDPELDLSQFNLLEGEKVIARALQKYGMVVVDNAGGSPIYAEGLWGQPGKSWESILREWEGGISSIPLDHFRVLKVGETVKMGDARFKDGPWWKKK